MAEKICVALGGSEGKMGKVLQRLMSEAGDLMLGMGIDPARKEVICYSPCCFLSIDGAAPHFGERKIDVYADFTQPDAVLDNVRRVSEAGVDSLIGTTGWYGNMNEMRAIASQNGRVVLYAPNFSVGVNAMFAATEYLAKLLGELGYDAGILELHHKGKKDSPSGTAQQLGEILVKNLPGKGKAAYARREKRPDEEVDVLGGRVGSVTGWHTVVFSPKSSDYERLALEHNASSRDAFGMGALEGIRWVYRARAGKREPGLYEFRRDVLGL